MLLYSFCSSIHSVRPSVPPRPPLNNMRNAHLLVSVLFWTIYDIMSYIILIFFPPFGIFGSKMNGHYQYEDLHIKRIKLTKFWRQYFVLLEKCALANWKSSTSGKFLTYMIHEEQTSTFWKKATFSRSWLHCRFLGYFPFQFSLSFLIKFCSWPKTRLALGHGLQTHEGKIPNPK